MTNPYPLPRETRETPIIVGDGRATYGPFGFKIWDVADVVASVSRQGGTFTREAVSAAKTAVEDFASFTVGFSPALLPGDTAIVRSRRLHERSTDVMRGGAISGRGLEGELSRQGTVLQELRRDSDEAETALAGEMLARETGYDFLRDLIGDILSGLTVTPIAVSSRAAVSALRFHPSVSHLLLAGYGVAGDGGGGLYVRAASEPGHAGKVRSLDGTWWSLVSIAPTPQMFGARSGAADATFAFDSGPAFEAWLAYVAAVSGYGLIPSGFYLSSRALVVASGCVIEGLGTNEAWETPFFDLAALTSSRGVTICMTGTGERVHTLDYCSAMRHSGAHRVNPVRSHANGNDQYFEATDFTNGDAVGTAKATLRPFSAALVLGSDGLSGKTIARNIRFVPACDDGLRGPLAGYLSANANAYVPWAEWDVGEYNLNPYTSLVEDCQFVGFWHRKGRVQTSIRGGNTRIGGRGEMSLSSRNFYQGGIAVRNGDFFPALAKTANSVTIAWSPGHRFDAAGTIYIDSTSYAYTGLTYDASGDGALTFTGIASTSTVVVSGDDRSIVHMTNNNGTTQSSLRDSNVRDFWHPSLVERPSPFYGAQAGKYSAAVELVGYPIRGIEFDNNTIYCQEPFFLMQTGARDIHWEEGTFEEKSYRLVANGPLNPAGAQQCVAICGPDKAHAAQWPMLQRGSVTLRGYPWSGRLNIAPIGLPVSGRRYSAFDDAFNPFFFDPGSVVGGGAVYDARNPVSARIAGGVLMLYQSMHRIDTEGSAASDDVDTIVAPGWVNEVTLFPVSSTRAAVYRHGTGNLNLYGQDVRVAGGQSICLFRFADAWYLKPLYEPRPFEGALDFDPPSLAAGASADAYVTVAGAVLGDFAIASFSQNVNGLTVTANVTAGNTVRVRLVNDTGLPIDVPAGRLRARVLK